MSGRTGEYCGTVVLDYHARPTKFLVSIGAARPHVACWSTRVASGRWDSAKRGRMK
jgi:hypothetical protein